MLQLAAVIVLSLHEKNKEMNGKTRKRKHTYSIVFAVFYGFVVCFFSVIFQIYTAFLYITPYCYIYYSRLVFYQYNINK